ncbi:two-component sensor histidine kinase [Streptomyces albus subsp. chlorinus]|uniref:sensor histidine kinase n=1 Tax=Streptomyces albus TaxID=1888 RepID=UPI001570F9AA|nr:histidine kinase [Streptomyces albus]NSC19796.1 two-component sensor histidine kinase [Streptomyces albus subsp. chlorinus]
MRTPLQQRFRAWIASPAYPWVTGGALTVGAVAELIAYPGSLTTTLGVLVSSASLMWRRSFPPVAVVTVAAGLLGFAGDVSLYISIMVSGPVGFYILGRYRVRHPAVIVVGGALGAVCVNLVHIRTWSRMNLPVPPLWQKGSLSLFAESFLLTVVIFGAVMMGDAVRSRDQSRRERDQAQAQLIALERQQAAEAERAAIARELHDIVSHAVSMIAVQAESATYATPGLTPEARDGFQQIAGTARSSMAELRRLLGVLRTPQAQRETALNAPQPTLDHLSELVEQHRAVGGEAELKVTGERVSLPATWELSAYRIAQEALTNARKHAPGARTVVEIDYGADQMLTLRVHDDGPGPGPRPASGAGHGLTGMRERAALVGGRLSVGAGPGGGFLVEARLPWGSGGSAWRRERV